MGVYKITNQKNGKIFIGSAENVEGRLNRIRFQLKLGNYPVKEIQQDYNDAGDAAFEIEVLDYLAPKEDSNNNYREDLNMLEEMWLDKLQPFGDKGYNIKPDQETTT